MPFKLFSDHGVLGINSRNLEYLRPFNRKKAVRMADSKLATKQFLSTRGIPVPRLIATIRSYSELERFDFNTLPDSFVLKPDAGFGGEGIIVVTGKEDGAWQKTSGDSILENELHDHARDILDGKFSIVSLPDVAFCEQRLSSVELVPELAVQGLPDLRIVVHNLVPVMAMLRIPTPTSDGKANVHLGGLGLGIDLAKGETTYATQYNELIAELPGGVAAAGHKIPHWDKVLQIASEAQLHTNLGYLAADIVLDEREGPVLIEVNARAGLMVQVANLAPLKKRLERIKGLKVDSPAKGVQLGKELFGATIKQKTAPSAKTVVGVIEPGEIILEEGTHRVRVESDPTHETAAIDRALAEKLTLQRSEGRPDSVRLELRLGGKRIKTVADLTDLVAADYKVILGRRDLAGFLIDPQPPTTEQTLPKSQIKTAAQKSALDYHALDKALATIDRQIKLLAHLRPTNLTAEQKKFVAKKGHYDPTFHYAPLKFDPAKLASSLHALSFPDTPLGQIFREKKVEIERKIALLVAIGQTDFTRRSRELYGTPTAEAVQSAQTLLAGQPKHFKTERATLDATAAIKEFEKAFISYKLKKWKVVLKPVMAADALAGKSGTLFLRSGAVFSPERVRALVAHEVATHILRTENGARQPYEIFARGLANYLLTEEGLAVYNQEQVMKSNSEKRYWPALNLLAVDHASDHSFSEVYRMVREYGFDDARAWKTALKVKRGLTDTREAGGFTKEHVYFSGFQKIQQFLASGGDLKELYIAKLKIEDLPLVAKMPELKAAKYLPEFY